MELWDIQDVVVVDFDAEKMDVSAGRKIYKVMTMSRCRYEDGFEGAEGLMDSFGESLNGDADMLMEEILENINTTPIGRVLKKIASLPEIRKDKVLNVRQQLNDGKYELNGRMDVVVDRVLEDLTA